MENERKTDRSADMGMDEHRLSDILLASQIKATDIYETPPQIIWIDNSTIATLGNFSASTGKAKSKKTFNVSALVAASLAGVIVGIDKIIMLIALVVFRIGWWATNLLNTLSHYK